MRTSDNIPSITGDITGESPSYNKPTPTKEKGGKSFFEKPYAMIAGTAISAIEQHKRARRQYQANRALYHIQQQEVERRKQDAVKSFREAHPEMAGSSFEKAIIDRIGQAAATESQQNALAQKSQRAERPSGFEELWSAGLPGLLASKR